MAKSIQLKINASENVYPNPYFPVGSIYLSVNNINPTKWFGGTWEQIAKGRTLVGVDTSQSEFNSVQKTGGSKTVTLTVNQIPSHNHTITHKPNDSALLSAVGGTSLNSNTKYDGTQYQAWKLTSTIGTTGGGQSHSNLQPYFTCYIWLRTA